MSFRIVYKSATLHHGRWHSKIAYIVQVKDVEKPCILESFCGYTTRDEAIEHMPELEADLLDLMHGVANVINVESEE